VVNSSIGGHARARTCSVLALAALCACGGSGSDAGEEASGFLRVAPGTVQAAESSASPEAPAPAPAQPVSPESAAKPEPKPVVPPAEVVPDQPVAEDGGWSAPAPDASDLELAGALLQRPYGSFAQLLERRTGSLPQDRRNLLGAFSAALAGQIEPARKLAKSLERSDAIRPGERTRLELALNPAVGRPVEASLSTSTSPLERAMDLALLARGARDAASAGHSALAAQLGSQLLVAEIQSPWASDREALTAWSAALMQAQASHRWNPRGAWPSHEVRVRPGDSLIAIRKRVLAERPELLLCTGLIARANGLANENAIKPDDVLRIPTDRASVIVDLSSRWTLYLLGDEVVAAWEVGVGKEEGSTRVGTFTIGDKQNEPMWFQPGRAPVPFGDPENPLGTRWLAWNEGGKGTSLGFHGTSEPDGVGGRVSLGCVRMRNADVETLYEILPRDATVLVQP
jgi:hypothetical protein